MEYLQEKTVRSLRWRWKIYTTYDDLWTNLYTYLSLSSTPAYTSRPSSERQLWSFRCLYVHWRRTRRAHANRADCFPSSFRGYSTSGFHEEMTADMSSISLNIFAIRNSRDDVETECKKRNSPKFVPRIHVYSVDWPEGRDLTTVSLLINKTTSHVIDAGELDINLETWKSSFGHLKSVWRSEDNI